MSPRRKPAPDNEPDATVIFSPEPDEAPGTNGNGSDAPEDLFADTGETAPMFDTSEERAPVKRAGPRTSAADLIQLFVGGIGQYLTQTGKDVPVGRVLQLEAPIVGNKFDALLAHTWLDGVLQPLIQSAEKTQGLGEIIMFPLLIGAYERNPAASPVIYPMLRQVVGGIVVDLVPTLKKRQRDEAKVISALADLRTDLDLDADIDPIDALIQSLFAGAPGFTVGGEEPPPSDEPAG